MAKKIVQQQSLPAATNPSGVKSVYCNNMEVRMSLLDVRLLFNEVVVEGGEPTVERRANVVMGVEHFKALVQVLTQNLQALERQIQGQSNTTSSVQESK